MGVGLMATTINVPGMGPTLFSPVLAHALEPGDMTTNEGTTTGLAWRVVAVRREHCRLLGACVRVTWHVPGFGDSDGLSPLNSPVLRAVGARAGGRAVTTEWEYDAAEHDPLTALRIPVVTSLYPRWYYLVSIVINESEDALWYGMRPTDHEVDILLSYLAYERAWYRDSYITKMAERPFDIDGGHNNLSLIKRGEGDWAYRRRTWTSGPMLIPSTFDGQNPLELVPMLDRIHSYGEGRLSTRWNDWRSARPELFGGGQR